MHQFFPRLIYRNKSCKTNGSVWLVMKTFNSSVNSLAWSLLKHLQLCFFLQLWFVLDNFWLHNQFLICGVFDTPPPKVGNAWGLVLPTHWDGFSISGSFYMPGPCDKWHAFARQWARVEAIVCVVGEKGWLKKPFH